MSKLKLNYNKKNKKVIFHIKEKVLKHIQKIKGIKIFFLIKIKNIISISFFFFVEVHVF